MSCPARTITPDEQLDMWEDWLQRTGFILFIHFEFLELNEIYKKSTENVNNVKLESVREVPAVILNQQQHVRR